MKIKKLLTIFSCFVLVLVAGIALAACGETPAALESITVDHSQAKNTFVVDDVFSADITVTAKYSDKTTKTLTNTDYTVVAKKDDVTVAKGETFTEAGVYIVDVTYGEKFANYSITVVAQTEVDSAEAIKTALIAATGNPSKTAYLKLTKDLTFTKRIAVNGVNLILDLNGHELKMTNNDAAENGLFRFDNSTSKIFNGSLTSVLESNPHANVMLNVNAGSDVTLENIDNTTEVEPEEEDVTRTRATSSGVGVLGGGKLTIKNCKITAEDQVISTNNRGGGEGEEINIINSTLTATDGAAVLLTSYADVNISGSTLEGKTAILAQLGDITVENSTLKSTTADAFAALSEFDSGTKSLDNAIIQLRANSYQDAAVEGEKLAIHLSGNTYQFAEGRTEGKTIVSVYGLGAQNRTNEFNDVYNAVKDLEGTAGNVVGYNKEEGVVAAYVSSEAELKSAINAYQKVVLDKDITLTEKPLEVKNNVTLDLNGHTITEELTWDESSGLLSVIHVVDNNTLILTGQGSIISDDLYGINVGSNTASAQVVVNGDILVQGDVSAIQIEKGAAIINGGTYKVSGENASVGSKFLLNCINGKEAYFAVLKGKFYNFDPSQAPNDDAGEGQKANLLAAEYVEVAESQEGSDTVYTVTDPASSYVTSQEELVKAIENAEDNALIVVADNITLTEEDDIIDVAKNIRLYVPEGVEVSTTSASKIFTVSNDATLTIEGHGTFEGSNKIVRVGYRNTGAEDQKASTDGHLVIKGGTFNSYNEVALVSGGTVEVLGGNFTSTNNDGKFTFNILDASRTEDAEHNTITVKGGTFHNFNPANCLAEGPDTNFVPAEGYTAVEGETGVWEVVADQEVSSLAELKAAIEKGGKIVLKENITIDDYLTVTKETYLDMNGKTLSVTNNNVFYVITENHTLTIDGNGFFNTTVTEEVDHDTPTFYVGLASGKAGKVVIKNGTFTSVGGTEIVYVDKGSAEILGGDYTADEAENKVYYTLNISDGAKSNHSGSIVVKGGTFHGFNPAHTANDPDEPFTYLPENYLCIKDDNDVWTVSEGGSTVSSEAELATALRNGGKIALSKDIVLNDYVTVSKETTLCMNGFKISVTGHNMFNVVTEDEVFTVEGNGTFESLKDAEQHAYAIFFVGQKDVKDGNLVIKNGTFTSEGTEVVYVIKGSATIEGGSYEAKETLNDKYFTINIYNDSAKNEEAKITITGGIFKNFNPAEADNDDNAPDKTNYLPSTGYESKQQGEYWIVSPDAE